MNDSTPYLDENGIRRDEPVMPDRHTTTGDQLRTLSMLVHFGRPDSVERRGWLNLLAVHGYTAVLEAVVNCYFRALGGRGVRNAEVQAVLDGRLPDGKEILPQRVAQRRTQVA